MTTHYLQKRLRSEGINDETTPWEIEDNKKEQDSGDACVNILESHQGVEGVYLGVRMWVRGG